MCAVVLDELGLNLKVVFHFLLSYRGIFYVLPSGDPVPEPHEVKVTQLLAQLLPCPFALSDVPEDGILQLGVLNSMAIN